MWILIGQFASKKIRWHDVGTVVEGRKATTAGRIIGWTLTVIIVIVTIFAIATPAAAAPPAQPNFYSVYVGDDNFPDGYGNMLRLHEPAVLLRSGRTIRLCRASTATTDGRSRRPSRCRACI